MKVFGKYLVKARVNGNTRLAHPGFNTKKDAVERLNECFERISDNLWKDRHGQEFFIEKNTVEYR